MDFFINRKRFEFVGRCEDETLGRSTAFLVALTTFSLPGMPMCPERMYFEIFRERDVSFIVIRLFED